MRSLPRTDSGHASWFTTAHQDNTRCVGVWALLVSCWATDSAWPTLLLLGSNVSNFICAASARLHERPHPHTHAEDTIACLQKSRSQGCLRAATALRPIPSHLLAHVTCVRTWKMKNVNARPHERMRCHHTACMHACMPPGALANVVRSTALPCSHHPLSQARARNFSIDGAESEEDANELSFYALRSESVCSCVSTPCIPSEAHSQPMLA